MEAQEEFVLQFPLTLVLERENDPFRVLIPFLSSLFKIFFWFTILLNANEMLMMLMT